MVERKLTQNCRKCSSAQPEGARYCEECGATLAKPPTRLITLFVAGCIVLLLIAGLSIAKYKDGAPAGPNDHPQDAGG